MKANTLIVQRFNELEQKARNLSANRKVKSNSDFYRVDAASARAWSISVLNLLKGVFGEDSIYYEDFYNYYQQFSRDEVYEVQFDNCRGIFEAAKEDYIGGYIFNVRGLIQAEVYDDVLDQATKLLQAGYKDAACVVAGVALETTLKELCTRNAIPLKQLDRMNADLCKSGVYNMVMQKQVTAWAERRNRAAHGEWQAYKAEDVDEMIRGISRLIAEYV